MKKLVPIYLYRFLNSVIRFISAGIVFQMGLPHMEKSDCSNVVLQRDILKLLLTELLVTLLLSCLWIKPQKGLWC